jgi:lipopolysaccharide transport system permease protein
VRTVEPGLGSHFLSALPLRGVRGRRRSLLAPGREALSLVREYRKVIWATTRIELEKRYAGSVLGGLWIVLQPTLLLSIYLFTYLVIFRMRFPGFSTMDYVLFVFSGLIPYLGFMEAVTSGCLVLRQNLHLVKNVMLPIELLPVRAVAVSLVSQMISLFVLLFLLVFHGNASLQWLWLPVVLALEVMLLLGLVWMLSVLGLVLPDVSPLVNLGVLFLMFVSPIGFRPDMVPSALRPVLHLNPIFYLTEAFRSSLFYGRVPDPAVAAGYAGISVAVFFLGAAFFRKFKDVLVDYE